MLLLHLDLPWQSSPERDGGDGGDGVERDEESKESEVLTPGLVKIVVIAGLGGDGYDTGVTSGALVVIGSALGGVPLTLTQESFLVTSALFGALAGSIVAGKLADWRGRKPVIVSAAALFAVGALEQGCAMVYKEIILGRILVGIGVGLASMILPVYLAEISPPAFRGRIVASLVVLITFGQVLAYLVDAIFFSLAQGWRWMFGLGAVPAVAQLVLSFSMPESPRYQIQQGRVAPARRTLQLLNPKLSGQEVQKKVEEIQAEVGEQHSATPDRALKEVVVALLWRDKANRRALLVATGLQAIQQCTGFNTLMYYSAKILLQAHLPHPASFALFVAMSNFLSTLVALRLIDKLGRRALLLRTLLGMVVGMGLLAVAFLFMPAPSSPDPHAAGPSAAAFVAIFAMVVFCCSYALGVGNAAWVVQSEVFHQDIRALGNGIATAVCWSCNLLVSSTFLYISKALTPGGAFALYAVIAALGWVFTFAFVPETKNLTLDEVRAVFEREVGVDADSRSSRGEGRSGRGQYRALEGDEGDDDGEGRHV
ncbi:hypothetical protein JCM11641_004723 [Rhodosporidiobolus odoratus]